MCAVNEKLEHWLAEQRAAYGQLAADGTLFAFTRPGRGAFDPRAGAYTPAEDQAYTAPGILKRLGTGAACQSWQASGLTRKGDGLLLIAAGDYGPELQDRVALSGESWTVMAVDTLRPVGVPLLHHLLIRKV